MHYDIYIVWITKLLISQVHIIYYKDRHDLVSSGGLLEENITNLPFAGAIGIAQNYNVMLELPSIGHKLHWE